MHTVEVDWKGNLQFNAEANGHTLIMDVITEEKEQNNFVPDYSLLTAIADANAISVIATLKKKHISVVNFHIRITGDMNMEEPIDYTAIHLVYEIKALPAFEPEILDAIAETHANYTGIAHLVNKTVPLSYDVIYNGKAVFADKPCEKSPEENVVYFF